MLTVLFSIKEKKKTCMFKTDEWTNSFVNVIFGIFNHKTGNASHVNTAIPDS